MARIAGVDLPKNKRIEIGLTYIYGIGRSSSQRILEKLDMMTEEEAAQFLADNLGEGN